MLSSIWRTAFAAAAIFALTPAASAAPAQCITDADLDAAVGEQVRAGAFAVSTAALGERPMCSGLTVAQAIQRLRQQVLPAAPPQPPRPAMPDTPIGESPASAVRADITRFLRFERPSWCESDAWSQIGGDAHVKGSAAIGALGRVTFESDREDDWHVLRAPVLAQWNGLTITGIEFYFVPESDINFRRIRFREPPARVGATLRRLGFGLSSGERIVETGGMEIQIAIMPHDEGGTALDCSGV
jgi:hypothetical protein